jgi:hypothetical protein
MKIDGSEVEMTEAPISHMSRIGKITRTHIFMLVNEFTKILEEGEHSPSNVRKDLIEWGIITVKSERLEPNGDPQWCISISRKAMLDKLYVPEEEMKTSDYEKIKNVIGLIRSITYIKGKASIAELEMICGKEVIEILDKLNGNSEVYKRRNGNYTVTT